MSIPQYDKMYNDFLEALKDGERHSLNEIKEFVAIRINITPEDRQERLQSGLQRVYDNRIGWTRTYLKKAELIESPERAVFVITERGKKALEENCIIDNNYLLQFESFRNFYISDGEDENSNVSIQNDSETPDDLLDKTFKQINKKLVDDILSEVLMLTDTAFEKLVVDLLQKMGYGGSFENSGEVTPRSNDEGIDGIIKEDKLGFNLIYIQAKLWDFSETVGRPDIQKFVGAISGKGGKGLFVTTTKFSKPAIEYAASHQIILIDGERLAGLMIEHNFGVTPKKVYEIKNVDTDMFDEYLAY